MKKEYSFKEILLGLYDDYINYYNNLEDLKKYVIVDNIEYKDFNIKFDHHSKLRIEENDLIKYINNKEAEIYVELIRKTNILSQKLIKLFSISNPTYMLARDEKSIYYSCYDGIKILNIKGFANETNKILNSDFVKYIDYSVLKKINNQESLYLNFNLNYIDITKFINNNIVYEFCGNFYSEKEKVIVKGSNFNKHIKNNPQDILNSKITSDMLNEYVISKIENNKTNNDAVLKKFLKL